MNRGLRRKQNKQQRRGATPRNADKALQKALSAVEAGDPATAFTLAIKILADTGRDDAAGLAAHAAVQLPTPEAAVTAFARLSELRPDDADIENDYGGALCQAGRFEDAERTYRRALDRRAGDGMLLANLGQALLGQKDLPAAEAAFRSALNALPNLAGGHHGLGLALKDQGRLADAVTHFRRAFQLEPSFRNYRDDLEDILKAAGEGFDERERMYRADLFKNADDVAAAMQLACVLRDTDRGDQARELVDSWIARGHDLALADQGQVHEILGELQFLQGDFERAWENHHWRLQRRERWSGPPAQPAWLGEPLAGKSIFVYAEQGVGDQIMYMALLPDLLARGARVVLESEARLVPLFQRSFADVECVAAENPPAAATTDPDIDYHVAMGSLGCWLWRDFAVRPASPFLAADPTHTQTLRDQYQAGNQDVSLVGIAWQSPKAKFGGVKSLSLRDLAPLFEHPNTRFIDLQYGDTAAERSALHAASGIEVVHDDGVDQWADLDAFAAQVAAMDAVVSISNSTVHMAGALGVPTTVLLSPAPQWKWGAQGETTPWYAATRLLRRANDETVAEQIRRAAALLV